MDKKNSSINTGVYVNIISIILGIVTLWTLISTKIENTTIKQTQIIASIISTDLRTRINLYQSYVDELKSDNKNVSVLLLYNIKSLEDQLNELKQWDTND